VLQAGKQQAKTPPNASSSRKDVAHMTKRKVHIAVAGPAGRLGSAILRAASTAADIELVAGLTRPGSGAIGLDLGAFAGVPDLNVPATDNLAEATARADVLIDVSTAAAAAEHARRLSETTKTALIIGATGMEGHEQEMIERASEHIAIVVARNFSLGVTLLTEMVRVAASRFDDEWDIEIVEAHHRAKADAPSGTAIALGEAAAKGRGIDLESHSIRARDGMIGPRKRGHIGFSSIRAGGIVGDHDVHFATPESILTFSHRALDRNIFAKGALTAARWIVDQKPGVYGMRDVLGLDRV
jgi:4-hydroxy-tetrahydrodipicolinate reductase